MKYTGRIIVVIYTWLNFLAWLIYKGHTFSKTTMILFLMSGIIQTIISWWLGYQYDQVQFYAHKDVMTNTYNRRFIFAIFHQLCDEMDRKKSKLSILMLDVDQLKWINDVYGHQLGDSAILHVSQSLHKHTRKSDFVARWGGDEFLLFIPDSDEANANGLKERIQTDLKEQCLQEVNIHVSVSVGISVYPDDGVTLNDLIKLADERMYMEKKELQVKASHDGLGSSNDHIIG